MVFLSTGTKRGLKYEINAVSFSQKVGQGEIMRFLEHEAFAQQFSA